MKADLKGFKPDTERWPVLRHGLISFNDTSIACFVLNRSRGGAGLVLQSDLALPLVFHLEIDGENIRRRCAAVWRDQCRLGVSFDIQRVAEIEDNRSTEEQKTGSAEVLSKEQSLDHLVSVLRFVALANVYKASVLAKIDGAPRAPENLSSSNTFSSRG